MKILAGICVSLFLHGCAVVPASPMGRAESGFTTASDVPRYVKVEARSRRGEPQAVVESILVTELPKLGFTVSDEKAVAVFAGELRWSGDNLLRSNDAVLTLELRELTSERVLWSTRLTQRGDLYQRPGEAAGILARRALELLEKDLKKVRKNDR